MTVQDQITTTARQTQEAWTNAAESWATSALQALQKPVNRFQLVDPTVVVDQFFDFAQHVLEINRQYAKNLAKGAASVEGAVRDHVGSIGEAVRDQVEVTVQSAREQTEKLEEQAKLVVEDVREEALAAERQAREEAKAAERAERAEARQAEKAARDEVTQKYADLTKVELADLLAERDLPKTGNVDELRSRLIEADVESVQA